MCRRHSTRLAALDVAAQIADSALLVLLVDGIHPGEG